MRAVVAAVVVLWAAAASAFPTGRPRLDAAALAPPRGAPGPWPLSELPSVQPHLDLAMAHDACTPAARQRQKDDEIRAYLAAWCRIRAGERQAVDALAPLAKSKNLPFARLALLDIINLIANAEPHQPAVAHLEHLGLASPHALDLLAATYLALGQRDDAFAVGNQAVHLDTHPTEADSCERRLAWWSLDQLHPTDRDFVEAQRVGACQRRLLALDCAVTKSRAITNLGTRLISMRECYVDLPDNDPNLEAKLTVIAWYFTWKLFGEPKDWLALSRALEPAFIVRGAEELAVGALERAADDNCDRAELAAVAAAAKRILGADLHDPVFDRRLAALAKPGQQCRN